MKTPSVVGIVVAAHVVAVGSAVLIQGCGTPMRPTELPSSEPPLPPSAQVEDAPQIKPFLTPAHIPNAKSWDNIAETTTYVVGPGDTLSGLATRFKVNMSDVIALNDLTDRHLIRVGQRLVLPGKIKIDQHPNPAASHAVTSTPKVQPIASGDAYVVKSGDSLSVIAQRYGTSVKALKEANSLKSDVIRIGQKLVIPGTPKSKPGNATIPVPEVPGMDLDSAPVGDATVPKPGGNSGAATKVTPVDSPPSSAPAGAAAVSPSLKGWNGQTHTVKEGEDVYSVALWWNVSPSELKELNGLTDSKLTPGQVLKIPMAE